MLSQAKAKPPLNGSFVQTPLKTGEITRENRVKLIAKFDFIEQYLCLTSVIFLHNFFSKKLCEVCDFGAARAIGST